MHWYTQEGLPQYTVIGSNNKERDTTLRDAKKKKYVPSVTTVTSILDKAGLLRYFHKNVIIATLNEKPQGINESDEDYITRIIGKSREESAKASKKGSELHNQLEKYYSRELDIESSFLLPVIKEVAEIKDIDVSSLIAEKSFSHSLGFGGKVDLCSLKGDGVVIDFKTKNTTDKKKFYKYNEHLMQLAAYREGLNIPKAECYDIYFSSIEEGIVETHKWTEEELQAGWIQFQHLLGYWQSVNKYNSSFNRSN